MAKVTVFTAALLAVTAITSSVSAAIIVEDVFLGKSAPKWGDKLNGTSPATDNTGISSNNWVANDYAVFFQNKNITTGTKGKPVEARIRIGSLDGNSIVEVSTVFSLNPKSDYGITTQASWAAVGFQSSTDVSSWFGDTNKIWAMVEPSGKWTLFQNGYGNGSTSGTLVSGGFAYGSTTTLTLKFNTGSSQVALFIGTENVSGWITTTVSAASISAAGFRLHENTTFDAGNGFVNSFTVSSAANIPESANIGLSIGFFAAIGLLAVRWRMARN